MMVYIAGPITAKDGFSVEDNVAAAGESYLLLSHAGIPSYCPHLTALLPGAFDVHYEKWMIIDVAFLEAADVVLMLPRWATSSGAVREHEMATALGKRIVYDVRELL